MTSYNHLRTLAFQIAPEITSLPREFSTLALPENWKRPLRELQAEEYNRREQESAIPIGLLNRALRALVPDLIAISPSAGQTGPRPWLHAAAPIDTEALALIIRSWVRVAFPRASVGRLARVLEHLDPAALRWQGAKSDLADWRIAPNGTAEPRGLNSIQRQEPFLLLPDLLAAELSRATLLFGGEPISFRRAPLSPGARGAEIVSWPPLWRDDRRGRWPHSVVITLTAQTVPFQPFPVIHCDLGLRRWAGPSVRLPGGRTSVYLLTEVPWLRGLHHSTSFQVAPLRWERIADSERQPDTRSFRTVWSDHLAPLLNALRPHRPFPDPDTLLADPAAGLNIDGSPSAAIVYRADTDPHHGVRPGLMPRDRRDLAEQITARLDPLLRPVPLLDRIPMRMRKKPKNPFLTAARVDGSDARAAERRAHVGRAVGGRLTIELWWQSEPVRTALVAALCEQLGLVRPTALPHTWHHPELILMVRSNPLGAIGDALDLAAGNGRRDRLHDAIRDRANTIKEQLPAEREIVGALVELDGKGKYEGDTDPKVALRRGFAHTKRLTQFITPADDTSLAHRASAAVLDLLRQFGVQPAPSYALTRGYLPDPLQVVGLWLVKQYAPSSPTRTAQILPVMVRIASDAGAVHATAPGLDHWLPYGQALLAIAQDKARGYDLRHSHEAIPFIRAQLQGLAGDTLLLCHAQNLRRAWPWVGNGRILRDQLAFGDETPSALTEWPGLRIVRVRDHDANETPEWYAVNERGYGLSRGLFAMGERVFASTHDKPVQHKVSPNLTKGGPDGRPDKQAWNPGLIEVTVAGLQPEDAGEAWVWAALTHELRQLALQYPAATSLPQPLHLAEQVKEYVLPLDHDGEG